MNRAMTAPADAPELTEAELAGLERAADRILSAEGDLCGDQGIFALRRFVAALPRLVAALRAALAERDEARSKVDAMRVALRDIATGLECAEDERAEARGYALAALRVLRAQREEVAEYRNAIVFEQSCLSCARLLSSGFDVLMRAERAEVERAKARRERDAAKAEANALADVLADMVTAAQSWSSQSIDSSSPRHRVIMTYSEDDNRMLHETFSRAIALLASRK